MNSGDTRRGEFAAWRHPKGSLMRDTTQLVTGAFVLLVAFAPPAGAAQQMVRGRLFVVNDPLPGVNSSRRHILVYGFELPSTKTVAGDPLSDGAQLLVIASGNTSSSQSFMLPPGAFAEPNGPGWRRLVKRRRAIYTYVDERGENGPVTSLTIQQVGRSFRIRATLDGRGNNPEISVVPPNPGSDGGMIVSINGGDSYCVAFGGAAGGKTTDNDAETFRITHPRLEGCPLAPDPAAPVD